MYTLRKKLILNIFLLSFFLLSNCSMDSEQSLKRKNDENRLSELVRLTNSSISRDLQWNFIKNSVDNERYEVKEYGDTLVILEYLNESVDFYGFSIQINKGKIISINFYKP